MRLTTTCPKCDLEIEVDCTPATRGRYHGRAEDCYEGSAAEFEPSDCPECHASLDTDTLEEQMDSEIEDAKTEAQIDRWEQNKEFARDCPH